MMKDQYSEYISKTLEKFNNKKGFKMSKGMNKFFSKEAMQMSTILYHDQASAMGYDLSLV